MIEVLKQALEALENIHLVEMTIEDLQSWNKANKFLRQAIKELESQEPVAWIALQKEAQQIVESKVFYRKFIDGTPLVNDIACWMADFALQHTHPPQRTEQNFCPRCGKRTNDIHTCTPPQEKNNG
jgi:NADH pyrophosphatase NudC (nudix superfamily)